MELDKYKIEAALARGLALLMEKETAHAFRTKQWGGRAWKPSNLSANLLIKSSMLRNSIHHTAVGNQVEVSSPLPYANIHNCYKTHAKHTLLNPILVFYVTTLQQALLH